MRGVNKSNFIFLGFLLLFLPNVLGQKKGSDRLKQEQKRLEQQLATTKSLLEASRKETENSLEEVKLLDQQIKTRERLLNNIDNQLRASDLKILQKQQNIQRLESEIKTLKDQFAKLLIYAYKKRSKYGDLMFIFSAPSLEEALKRKLYLEKLTEVQQKQLRVIQENMELLEKELVALEEEKKIQLALANQKRKEREEILVSKQEKEKLYQAFKQKEQQVMAELRAQELQQEKLRVEIQRAIEKEIAEEQARLEKIRREEEARKKAEAAKKGEVVATVVTPDKAEKPSPFIVTKEVTLEGASFAANKGRLPWPVEKGTITQGYGRKEHPTLPGVILNNNGVDISAPKNALVRAVFDGEVTSVISILGAGKVVIVKHGNYRTVYSNLDDVYVSKGSKVTTKMPIGSLLPSRDGSLSVAHFEVHEVVDGQVKQLNPALWIAQ